MNPDAVTLYKTNSDSLFIRKGDGTVWHLGPCTRDMEGTFAADAAGLLDGTWTPSEDNGQTPTTVDGLTEVARWTRGGGVTLLVASDHLGGAQRDYIGALPTTYTAWITTDGSALAGDMCDVVVLANDEDGASTGDPVWQATTTVPYAPADRDDDELCRQATDLLLAAGWHTKGNLEAVPPGYIVDVWKAE